LKIVIVIRDNETRRMIAEAIASAGEETINLTSLADLPEVLRTVPVSGIMVGVVAATKAAAAEKQQTHEMIQFYPHVRIKGIGSELAILGNASTLKEFINECQQFQPRTIRKSERRIRHIAFLLSADEHFADQEKTVTMNISEGGCFVYSTRTWQVGDRVWLKFADNERVVTGTVRWWQPWGNNKRIPGIGICFDAAS